MLARKPVDGHADRTELPFVTLDPATSTDLDQAFCFSRDAAAIVLHYAIADVGWFVPEGSLVDAEAWRRGASIYLPDGKEPLYPPVISEAAASLLPDGPRPAVIFEVRVDEAGEVELVGVERSLIRSRAKLAYDQVTPEQLPADFHEFAERIQAAEARRGASRVDPPEQEVNAVEGDGYELRFRPRLRSEAQNSALSLACNLAVAKLLFERRTGLFRVMAEPTKRAVRRLRHTAQAFAIDWPAAVSLEQFETRLDPSNPRDAAMMMAIRRAGEGASYVPYREGAVPFHSAMAATYAHATAPLRRLADRYVVEAALAVANGLPVPASVAAAFEKLPGVMAKTDSLDANLRRAVVDLAEAVMLMDGVGATHSAVVTDVDDRGTRIQLCDLPIVSRVVTDGASPGDALQVKLTEADPDRRLIRFERAA
ncbi:RNB domain-containing ribonuclease [Sphingomonas rhizophila]|uniref:RNB domain-containing ribonuclease n=1 Tax=Sphingomonas rhizophila TaxID=2071607 RepID=UPI001FEC6AB1|nr:RNB domain-containing ribonuclease [Sphingomonas rhizophila]